ncbi:FAD/NAD(P)-binding domain-containing protein [Hymenopellis radicata]|nr:FAD/NAD(P)-binding domain-containing protein [Hymenopellis radicata]
MKLAIVGGGASSFYVASRLLRLTKDRPMSIHVFDRLWAPHGLVRYGVAPDHPEVKNCTRKFDRVAQDPRFRFFGNVNVYRDTPSKAFAQNVQLPLSSLYDNYSHLLFASGCPLPVLHPALPPSTNCIPALNIVHWYTQHPSNAPPPPLDSVKHVTIIGNGNVALDVARMLLTPPDVLRGYDVPEDVLAVLERSTVKHVSIVARRGPFEAAFTTKELREMMKLPTASMVPIPDELLVPGEDKEVSRPHARSIGLLEKGSMNEYGTTSKTWSLDFYRMPLNLSNGPTGMVLTLGHTAPTTSTRVARTGETSTVQTDLVIPSLGFQGDPSSPYYDEGLRHIKTVAGRVALPPDSAIAGRVYASGWAAMGAKGVLAATMMDSYGVADTILSDLSDGLESLNGSGSGSLDVNAPPAEIVDAGTNVLSYEDWKKVDAEEVRKGKELGKERERISWEEIRALLGRA